MQTPLPNINPYRPGLHSKIMFEWILTLFSLFGTWFNIRKNIYCWPLWTIANVGWVYSFGSKKMMAESILFSVYFILSTYGWYRWYQDKKTEKSGIDV